MNIPATILLALLGAFEVPDAAELGIDYAEQSVRAIQELRIEQLDRDLYRAREQDRKKKDHDTAKPRCANHGCRHN